MIPVILSGGSGTRLWPVSRASHPKQFCDFYDRSFLANTLERVKPLGSPFILTVASMEALTLRIAKQEGLSEDRLLFEPFGKNTAPAVGLLCHILKERGFGREVIGLFPSDHLIVDNQVFQEAIQLAASLAQERSVVTLGIPPLDAATGYGYIECEKESLKSQGKLKAHSIRAFHEKPDQATAEAYLQTGRHYWNAGIFIFQVDRMIEHFQRLQPTLWGQIRTIRPDMSNSDYVYALLPATSLDYAIMEKVEDAACIPCEMGWSDVGSWDELARLSEESSQIKTVSSAEVFSVESSGNYVFSVRDKIVGLVGVRDLLIVETPDALLISKRGESQKVKDLVDRMKDSGITQATEHPFETRPWGGFEILSDQAQFKAKKITVDPGGQLSYQTHEKRDEHWVIVSGQGELTLDGTKKNVGPGDNISIPRGAKHRIRNCGGQPLIFIEVQTGNYFGEDDIVRYQDDYNRPVQNEDL